MYIRYAHVLDLLTSKDTKVVLDLMWNCRARWRFIGTVLQIDVGTLDAIDANNKNVEDCLRDMINHWLHSAKPRPTRDAICLLYTSPSPRDATLSRMPSSA